MEDPYKVLNVSPSLSEEEIKKKYMTLVKRYHPDRNPNDKYAEQKMKEINAAYEQIKSGNTSNSYGSYSNQGYYGSYSNNNASKASSRFDACRNYINNRYYKEALVVLSSISERTSLWYYYFAVASYGLGRREDALSNIKKAVSMEPNNREYQYFLNQLENPGNIFGGFGMGYGGSYENRGYPSVSFSPLKFIFGLFLLRFLFSIFFGML